jgi:CheY-like chemotaxis protein
VADDNQDSADSVAMLLRLDGHEVQVAYDGEEAARAADAGWPQILVLDIGMPRLNGYQVAEHVRTMPWGRDVVMIAATGWGQDEDRRRSIASGFDAHLVKPIDPRGLTRLMGELVSRAPVS